MVLDDEDIILDGLKAFPWDEYGYTLVACAQNGRDGLEKVKLMHPNLVLTDIKMPEMDGLSFAAKVKEIDERIRIVFLTGYDNFEYAQEAIRIGGSDYLLKPVNPKKLVQMLQKIRDELTEEETLVRYYENLQKNFNIQLPFIKTRLISDLIHGRIENKLDFQVKAEMVGIHIEKFICATFSCIDRAESNREDWPERFAFLNIGEEILAGFCDFVLSEFDESNLQYVFVLVFNSYQDEQLCIKKCDQAVFKLGQTYLEVLHQHVYIGISTVGNDSYYLNLKYIEACQAREQNKYLGEFYPVHYEDLRIVAKKPLTISEGSKSALLKSIYSGRVSEICNRLDELYVEEHDLNSIKSFALDLLISCIQYPYMCRVQSDLTNADYDFSFLQDGIAVIQYAQSQEEIWRFLRKGFLFLSRQMMKNVDDRYLVLVTDISQYIENHYQEDLTLENIAENFHISKTYVSRLLKKYKNSSFLKILVDVRMKEAKKMILEDKYRIYEIAEKVGYNDFSYFIQAFKKKYGVTPLEYRKGV